jgi:cell fate regulator YaaT (PSP1 superfamily)
VSKGSKPKVRVAGVRFQPTGKVYHFNASDSEGLRPGDFVLVDTARGQQLGEVVCVRPPRKSEDLKPLKPVRRQATGRDMALRQQWQERDENVLSIARDVAAELGLPVKIILAEHTFDGQRLTLLYGSKDDRLDLGKLQQRLQRMIEIQVDLRQIGPRDQAKLMGGYGACGELRCCSCFLPEFKSISIKMAKKQGVSLHPSAITGMCDRLRCCMHYEYEQYVEACRQLPRRKKRVRTPHGEGKVVDLLPLKGAVVVKIEDRRLEVPAEEVELIST